MLACVMDELGLTSRSKTSHVFFTAQLPDGAMVRNSRFSKNQTKNSHLTVTFFGLVDPDQKFWNTFIGYVLDWHAVLNWAYDDILGQPTLH